MQEMDEGRTVACCIRHIFSKFAYCIRQIFSKFAYCIRQILKIMETLFNTMERRLMLTPTTIVRDFINDINWNKQLISIKGSRGVGKTTLMLQYIKLHYERGSREVLYCSLDSFYFTQHSILELAEQFYLNGGRHLFLDEIHKYPDWKNEIKQIYDDYPDLRVVVSGSSLLSIRKGDADLSRRCFPYYMPGLSLREYMIFYKNIHFPRYSLTDILEKAPAICGKVLEKCSPVAMFNEYCRQGYYPFFDGNREDYYISIENVVNYIIEQELPILEGVNPAYVRKLKVMVSVIANSLPFEVDITKLSRVLEINRETVMHYLNLLNNSDILNLLYSDLLSVKKMQKPDKIYLQNTNLLYALSKKIDIGTMRETFAMSELSPNHKIEYGKEKGDFLIDGEVRLEIGGSGKGFSQISGEKNSYVFADNIERATGRKLPLWLLGFLY